MSREVGTQAENRAVSALIDNGYRIIERNYFARVGEIDIIARKEDILCFVEVKFRGKTFFGSAIEAISKTKIEKILKTIRKYLDERNIGETDYRIDAVIIDGKNIDIIENIYTEGMD